MSQTYILHVAAPNRDRVLANLHAFIDRLPSSKSWRIEVKHHIRERSLEQNAAMWGVAEKVIADFCGYRGDREKKELHRTLCGEYFGWRDDPVLGLVPVRTTTTNERGEREVMNTQDAADFYSFIQQFAAERLGCDVPDPDPLWSEK